MDFGGHEVDRFYHVITPADARMIAMAEELGLGDELRFRPVGAGFFTDGEMHDFNGIGDLLRFSPLTPLGARCASAGSSPSASCASYYDARRDAARDLAAPPLRQAGRRADLEAAARLPLRRRPRRAARDLPLGADPAHVAARATARAAAARRWATSSAATSG